MTRKEWNKRKGRSSSFIRRSTRFAIYARDNFDCVYCRQVFPPYGLTLDHVVPRSKGGMNDPSNLVTACRSCNSKRHARAWPTPHRAVYARVRRQRKKPINRRAIYARVRRQLKKPINRELGRWLARFAKRVPTWDEIGPL